MSPKERDVDATGVMPKLEVRLADFLHDDPPLPRALLLVVSGPARGQVLSVEACPCTVGRGGDVELEIDDHSVSRRHAVFVEDDGALLLEDLGSSNGSTINGNPLTGAMHLVDGDLIGFGEATVLVKLVR